MGAIDAEVVKDASGSRAVVEPNGPFCGVRRTRDRPDGVTLKRWRERIDAGPKISLVDQVRGRAPSAVRYRPKLLEAVGAPLIVASGMVDRGTVPARRRSSCTVTRPLSCP